LNKFIRYTEIITCFPGYIASGLIIPLIVATCYEVFARYVLNNPTIWAYEFGYLLMGFHFLLGGALTLKKQEHIRIDIFYNRLSNKKKAVIDLFFYTSNLANAFYNVFKFLHSIFTIFSRRF